MKALKYSTTLAATLMTMIVSAQNPFTPTTPGTVLEYEVFDAKGKTVSYHTVTILDAALSAGSTVITTRMEYFDAERNPSEKMSGYEYTTEVTADKVIIRKEALMPPMKLPDNLEFSISGDDLIYPATLKTGDQMPDYTLEFHIRRTGDKSTKGMTMTVTGRTVVSKDRVTVPAGVFECWKVTETTEIKAMMGMGGKTTRETWCAPGIGTVMSRQIKKGKVEETIKLLSVKQL